MVSREVMMDWVVDCLRDIGGKGFPKEVAKYIWEHHETELRKSDLRTHGQYDIRWLPKSYVMTEYSSCSWT